MPKSFLKYFVLLAFAFLSYSHTASAQVSVGVSINVAPPELPEYDQPECPGDGYIWTPGYWAYDDDYYWVPGTWVEAPEVGYLWTPPYWGWGGSGYLFHAGYWGPQVGFYGGISYGFGYFGNGYEGGRWQNNHFYYNTTVNRVNVTVIHNTYNTTIVNRNVNRVSYNGGNGGINRRPDAREENADRERHVAPVAAQNQHFQEARSNRDLRASVNHGKPPVAATAKPGDFHGNVAPARTAGVVHESGGNPAANNGANANRADRPNFSHAKDVQHETRPPVTSSGDAKRDQKFQQQQQKLDAKQAQDHQKLVQKQEADHAKLDQRKANDSARQRVESQHRQQTQKLEQHHTQQQTHMEQHAPAPRQAPAPRPAPAPHKP